MLVRVKRQQRRRPRDTLENEIVWRHFHDELLKLKSPDVSQLDFESWLNEFREAHKDLTASEAWKALKKAAQSAESGETPNQPDFQIWSSLNMDEILWQEYAHGDIDISEIPPEDVLNPPDESVVIRRAVSEIDQKLANIENTIKELSSLKDMKEVLERLTGAIQELHDVASKQRTVRAKRNEKDENWEQYRNWVLQTAREFELNDREVKTLLDLYSPDASFEENRNVAEEMLEAINRRKQEEEEKRARQPKMVAPRRVAKPKPLPETCNVVNTFDYMGDAVAFAMAQHEQDPEGIYGVAFSFEYMKWVVVRCDEVPEDAVMTPDGIYMIHTTTD